MPGHRLLGPQKSCPTSGLRLVAPAVALSSRTRNQAPIDADLTLGAPRAAVVPARPMITLVGVLEDWVLEHADQGPAGFEPKSRHAEVAASPEGDVVELRPLRTLLFVRVPGSRHVGLPVAAQVTPAHVASAGASTPLELGAAPAPPPATQCRALPQRGRSGLHSDAAVAVQARRCPGRGE